MRFFFVAICLILITRVHAQNQNTLWLASVNNFRIKGKVSFLVDLQWRSSDNYLHTQTIILRPALNYHFNKSITATAGYAYIPNRRTIMDVSDLVPEQRIWEQLTLSHSIKKLQTAHRFRFEQRFLPVATLSSNDLIVNSYNNAYRLRYFIRNIVPFSKEETFTSGVFLALQNEIFLNTGNTEQVNGKTFDQNRAYIALAYRFKSKIDLEAGYLNQYVNGRANSFTNHVAQVIVYKRL